MTNINSTNFRRNLFELLEQTIKFNEPIIISTKDGNAVLLSEKDYKELMKTLYLGSIPGLKESILEGANTPTSELVAESEVQW
ncbi:MAG: type II toxin-antitoxin system Phd/YefM family antitoxin [Sphaerochaeta sp.]